MTGAFETRTQEVEPSVNSAWALSPRGWILVLLPFLLLAWFLPGMLDAGFGWDDRQLLFENTAIRDFSWGSLWTEGFWSFRGHGGMYRPLTALSLALDHQLFGDAPLGYHRVNLILHLLACLLMSWGLLGPRSAWALPAFLVLYFHPAAAEQSLWIAGRVGSLMLCFGGAAMLLCRSGKWLMAAFLILLAGLCRDDGVLFFLFLPLCLSLPLRSWWPRALPFLLAWISLRLLVLGGDAFPTDPELTRSILQRSGDLLASFGSKVEVLFLLARPRLMQESLPPPGFSAIALPLLLGWLAWAWRKGWCSSVRAGLALLLAFLPFSSLFSLGEPVGGRYAYALLPWLLAMGVLLPAVGRLKPLWCLPSVLLLLPFWLREARVLARAETTYARVLEYEPTSRRARLNLALEWERLGHRQRALSEFEELIRQYPRYSKPAVNRGRLLYLMGQKQRGLAALDRATRDFPRSSRGWLTYGRLLYREKRDPEAIHAFERCLSIRSTEVQAYIYLCRARWRNADAEGAREAFEALRLLAPGHPALVGLSKKFPR